MKAPHTSAPRGKRLRIVMRDGTIIVDHFIERTGQFVVTEHHRLRGRDIKSFTIQRGNHRPAHTRTTA